jgi:hypothetical protein
MSLGGIPPFGVQRIGDVPQKEGAIVLEVRAQVGGQRIDGLIDDHPLAVAAPSVSAGWQQRETHCGRKARVEALSEWIEEHAPHFKMF